MAHDPLGPRGYRLTVNVKAMPPKFHDEYKDLCPLTHVRDDLLVGDLGSATITADLSTIQFLINNHHTVEVVKVQSFTQSNIWAEYVDDLAQKRASLHLLKSLESDPHKRAAYDAEMQDFKDALNFVTGCCIGKVQDYVKPKLRTTKEEEQLGVRDCSRADGRGWQLFGETVVTYSTSSAKDYKPRPVGVTVRDRGLVRIKWFFYNILRPTFPGCRLLYTDWRQSVYSSGRRRFRHPAVSRPYAV